MQPIDSGSFYEVCFGGGNGKVIVVYIVRTERTQFYSTSRTNFNECQPFRLFDGKLSDRFWRKRYSTFKVNELVRPIEHRWFQTFY